MPEMGGIEATHRIRKDFPPDKQPIIIALTANAFIEDKHMCLGSGMQGIYIFDTYIFIYIALPSCRKYLSFLLFILKHRLFNQTDISQASCGNNHSLG